MSTDYGRTGSGAALPVWQCPDGHFNLMGQIHCQGREFDTTHPGFEAVPTLGHGDKLETRPLRVPVVHRCQHRRSCDKCGSPESRMYPEGPRCTGCLQGSTHDALKGGRDE